MTFFATGLELIKEREVRSLSTNVVELANDGHCEHRASRETGDGAHCGRARKVQALYPGPHRWRGSRERGGRRTRLREKLFCWGFFICDPCKVFQPGRKVLHERGRDFFSFRKFGFIFVVFAVLLCWCAVLCFLFRTYSCYSQY